MQKGFCRISGEERSIWESYCVSRVAVSIMGTCNERKLSFQYCYKSFGTFFLILQEDASKGCLWLHVWVFELLDF